MSTTIATTRRRTTTAPTTLRTKPIGTASLHLDTAIPTAKSTLDVEFSLIQPDTAIHTSSTTTSTNIGKTTSSAASSVETCLAESDCATNGTCADGKCISLNDAAPLGGSSSEPTSHLNIASAIGASVGVVAFIALLVGFSFWFWRIRGRRPRKSSIEAPSPNRTRSASNATDQKTLVASLPNSPQDRREPHEMPPEFFAKAFEYNETGKEKAGYRSSESIDNASDGKSIGTEKALPNPPPTQNPLPPPPTEPIRYAIKVNINKSMIFDDVMLNAVKPLRDKETPRERAPRYRFEEYLPSVATTPRISISRPPASSERSLEYELERYSKRTSSGTTSTTDDRSNDETEPQSPRDTTHSKLGSKAPQLPLPELPPPSPSFSFRSYDWYQDIIGDQLIAGFPTPTTQATSPALRPLSLGLADADLSLVPGPLSPTAPPTAAALHLHPNSAALFSPTNPEFRLPPTVYTPPSRSPKLPSMPPQPPTPPQASKHVSIMSTTTRATHDSRSWLPDDGLYLAEDGTINSYKRFRRPSDDSRPTSYSPLN